MKHKKELIWLTVLVTIWVACAIVMWYYGEEVWCQCGTAEYNLRA